jgi:hypothetical protein
MFAIVTFTRSLSGIIRVVTSIALSLSCGENTIQVIKRTHAKARWC